MKASSSFSSIARSPTASTSTPAQKLDTLVETTRTHEQNAWSTETARGRQARARALAPLLGVPGPTVAAIARLLPGESVVGWVGKLDERSLHKARPELLEVLAAMPAETVARLNPSILARMDFFGLSPREEAMLVRIVSALPDASVRRILAEDKKKVLTRLFRRRDALEAESRSEVEAALALERCYAERLGADARALEDERLNRELDAHATALMSTLSGRREARLAFAWLAHNAKDLAILGALVRELDRRNCMERLLRLVGHDEHSLREPEAEAMLARIVEQRTPGRNLTLAEALLAKSTVRHRVTPQQAKLAHTLVRGLPLELQQRFRASEGGALLLRLEGALDRKQVEAGAFRGIEVEIDPATGAHSDPTPNYAEALRVPENSKILEALTKALKKPLTQAHAREAHAKLGELEDPIALRAIVRRLDTLGLVEPMLKKLGPTLIFDEQNRPASLKILAARDPIHLAGHTRRLLSLGILDWSITNGDAFFALHMLKALPESERRAFLAERGGKWWPRIEKRLTPAMRKMAVTHLYTGGPDGAHDDAIRAQLLRADLWSGSCPESLSTLVRIAQAAGDGRFAFEASRRHSLFERQPGLVERHGLFHPEKHPKYTPETVDPVRWFDEGPLGALNEAAFKLLDAAVVLGKAHLSDFVGVSGISFDSIQSELRRARRSHALPNHRDDGAQAKLTLKTDPIRGVVEVEAGRLELDHFDIFKNESRIDARNIVIVGLEVNAHYPTRKNSKPAYLQVHIDRIELEDAVVADFDTLKGASRILLEDIRYLQASPSESDDALCDSIRNLRARVPVVGHVSGAIARILSLVFSGGIGKGGVRQLGEPLGPMRQELRIGHGEITGLMDGQGRGFERLTLDDASLSGGGSSSARLRAAGRPEEVIRAAEAEEGELLELERARRSRRPLTSEERTRLNALESRVGRAGYAVQIATVNIEQLRGGVIADAVRLRGLSGDVDVPTLGFRVLHEPEFLEDLLASGEGDARRDMSGTLKIEAIDIDKLSTTPTISSSSPSEATDAEARARFFALEAKGLRRLSPEEQEAYVRLADTLMPRPDLEIEHLELRGAGITSAPKKDEHEVRIASASASSVNTGLLTASRVSADDVVLSMGRGGANAELERATLERIEAMNGKLSIAEARLEGLTVLGRPSQKGGLGADRARSRALELDKLLLSLDLGRHAPSSSEAVVGSSPAPGTTMDGPHTRLGPLDRLTGHVVAWTPLGPGNDQSEANIDIPIVYGRVDPAGVTSEVYYEPTGLLGALKNIAGNFANAAAHQLGRLRIDEDGLVLGVNGVLKRTLLRAESNEGLHADVGRRGEFDVREWVEGAIARPHARSASETSRRTINFETRDLRLGEGRIDAHPFSLSLTAREQEGFLNARGALGEWYEVYSNRLGARDIAWSTGLGPLTGDRLVTERAALMIAPGESGSKVLSLSLGQTRIGSPELEWAG